MEGRPQNPESRIIPENFHKFKLIVSSLCTGSYMKTLIQTNFI